MKHKQLRLAFYVPSGYKRTAPWTLKAIARKFFPKKTAINAKQLPLKGLDNGND